MNNKFENKNSSQRKKNYNMYYQKVRCRFCKRLILNVNIRRHQRLCRENKEADHEKYICEKCGASCIKKDTFNIHVKKCNGVCTKGKIRCTFKDCTKIFRDKILFMEHLIQYHDYVIENPITNLFKSLAEFEKWKAKEEEEKCSYFLQDYEENGNFIYFYCQHDQSLKPFKKPTKLDSKTDRVRIRKRRSNEICIAMMQLFIYNDGTCLVKYFPTHSHSIDDVNDLLHQQQTRETNELMDHEIAYNVSTKDVVSNLQKDPSKNNECTKISKNRLIASKHISLRKRKINTILQYEKLLQLQYECAAMKKSDVKQADDSVCILFDSIQTDELENKNMIEMGIHSEERESKNEFEEIDSLHELNYENIEEATIHITKPGKEWIVSLTDDPCAFLVHKVQGICSKDMCNIEYSKSEFNETLCPHMYTCTCAEGSDVCIHIQKVHSVESSDISTTEYGFCSQDEVIYAHKEVECILSSEDPIEKERIVTDLKKSCQTLLALTDFMSLNVIGKACDKIDKLVKKCENLINFTDLSDNSTIVHALSDQTINFTNAVD